MLDTKGQVSRWSSIDSLASNLPAEVFSTTDQVVAYSKRCTKSETERARFLYTWEATHISYDVKTYLAKIHSSQDAETVFKNQMGICEGYSNLFKHLCDKSGLQCFRVDGISSKGSDHSWNAVQLDGEWHLVDITWAAGGVSPANTFIPEFSDQYFSSNPVTF